MANISNSSSNQGRHFVNFCLNKGKQFKVYRWYVQVQILDVASGTWSFGPELPTVNLEHAQAVPHGDTFLVVGGQGSDPYGNTDTILEFDNINMVWIEREERLALARQRFFMIGVERERFCS